MASTRSALTKSSGERTYCHHRCRRRRRFHCYCPRRCRCYHRRRHGGANAAAMNRRHPLLADATTRSQFGQDGRGADGRIQHGGARAGGLRAPRLQLVQFRLRSDGQWQDVHYVWRRKGVEGHHPALSRVPLWTGNGHCGTLWHHRPGTALINPSPSAAPATPALTHHQHLPSNPSLPTRHPPTFVPPQVGQRSSTKQIEISVSFLEIYCDKIRDLGAAYLTASSSEKTSDLFLQNQMKVRRYLLPLPHVTMAAFASLDLNLPPSTLILTLTPTLTLAL